jgi:hypothetical protein
LSFAAQLANPKGFVAIVTDFVSTLTCPGLLETTEANLPSYAAEQIRRRNFFNGLNPFIVRQALAEVLASMGKGSQVQMLSPWAMGFGTPVSTW